MPEEQGLTGPEIMSQLSREAERFYKKFHARDPAAAASDFQEAYLTLFRNIDEWTADRPQLPKERRAKGRKLFEPSQERSRILTELRDVADILDSIAKQRGPGKTKRGRPRQRTEVSKSACEAILGPSSVRKALFAPLCERGSRTVVDGEFKQAVIWGHDDSPLDTILIKRASAQMARDSSITGYGLSAVARRLFPETARRLLESSNGLRRDVPIEALVEAMDTASITNLAENARAAERELRLEFGTEHLDKDVQPNHTITDFRNPAPFYRFVCAALEAGWLFETRHKRLSLHDRERLLEEPTGRKFEAALIRLLKRAIEWTKQIGAEFYEMDNVELFVGIDILEILNDKALTREDDDLEQEVPSAVSRIALRIVRLRERIVVLRDHAATMERWCDLIRERAKTESRLLDDAIFLKTHGFYRMSETAQECEHQYYEGVFYAPDWRRRTSGTPSRVSALSVELLRKSYPTNEFGGTRWADVTVKGMKNLLDCLYDKDDPILARITAILEACLVTRNGVTELK
ncbi:hypothetical protein [Bradyrhizobium japonicum]|uniref:hypothetical protein n=1 Tax=Bradyrhizobium japonicum TaxID=375 RepID=UPI00040A3679|nr:hypothetical protein [Bradyrhizobium japonicum]AHY55118.1 hypothetical protein BJS_04638 [Bradyrhizobium japonicum SEMIA 5079]MCD9110648.1 hypothetical protein [Bradyrhizobium japonicum]MCD9258871.1 hypothetical protein [Bradyrhizobium japonicum SEMIA 5079]MCD9823058.1 hypothetical protein [Bradyrhizobium japonicum]MCD9895312.1 hypothetical protein [Bradyrhizobium japonicum]